jgi:hypothetical protein
MRIEELLNCFAFVLCWNPKLLGSSVLEFLKTLEGLYLR